MAINVERTAKCLRLHNLRRKFSVLIFSMLYKFILSKFLNYISKSGV